MLSSATPLLSKAELDEYAKTFDQLQITLKENAAATKTEKVKLERPAAAADFNAPKLTKELVLEMIRENAVEPAIATFIMEHVTGLGEAVNALVDRIESVEKTVKMQKLPMNVAIGKQLVGLPPSVPESGYTTPESKPADWESDDDEAKDKVTPIVLPMKSRSWHEKQDIGPDDVPALVASAAAFKAAPGSSAAEGWEMEKRLQRPSPVRKTLHYDARN